MLLRLQERLERMNPGKSHGLEPQPAPVSIPHTRASNPFGSRPWQHVSTPYGDAMTCREELPRLPCTTCPSLERLLQDPRLRDFRMDDTLYLDIEATGLSHGAGTLAFLIGLAWFEDEQIVFEQLFVEDPTQEMAVLSEFLERLERFRFLVSFNGKSYDLSVLHSRLVITRLFRQREGELKLRPHLDLLHTSRQAYKGLFDNVRLQTLEREVLGLDPAERADDIPGSLVPTLYFHYLQTGDARHLEPVFKHNRTDVLSMIRLTAHLLELMEAPGPRTHPLILYNLGRAALRRRLDARAAELIGRAIDSGRLPAGQLYGALLDRVTAARRVGRLLEASAAARAAAALVPAWDEPERARLQRQITRYERQHARRSLAKPLVD